MNKDAEFHQLRAAGAFLGSASLINGQTKNIEITSEARRCSEDHFTLEIGRKSYRWNKSENIQLKYGRNRNEQRGDN